MDSLEIEGKEYISAKRAAQENSYTMDYIGQLIRGGKLVGKKVGRAWYVEQDSLGSYLNSLLKTQESVAMDNQEAPVEEIYQAVPQEVERAEPTEQAIAEVPAATQPTQTPVAVREAYREPERPVYHYPMLNYVSENERNADLLPNLGPDTEKEQPVAIKRTYQEEIPPQASYEEPQRQAYDGQVWQERRVGRQNSYLPAKRLSFIPIAIGAAAIVLILTAVGVSTFFVKQMNYQDGTASVAESISFSSFFNESR